MSFLSEASSHANDYLDFETTQKHTRCSGCGNYGILNALMMAVTLEGYKPHEIILACDVGCSGNVSDKIETYTIHGLHGRVLPLATGTHCARPDLPVIAMAGDGATLSEWVNHLIHSARNNYNITFLLHNNHNYWLTTGQASSTTPKGTHMKWTVGEVVATPLEAAKLVVASGGTFVARWYSGNPEQLVGLIRAWMNHKGFALVEILQHCPTYSKATPAARYEQKVYDVTDDPSFDPTNTWDLLSRIENYDRLATGILYQDATTKDFTSLQPQRLTKNTTPVEEVEHYDIHKLLQHFAM